MAEGVYTALEKFKKGKDPGQTLENLDKYVKRANLVFTTADVRTDAKKIVSSDMGRRSNGDAF